MTSSDKSSDRRPKLNQPPLSVVEALKVPAEVGGKTYIADIRVARANEIEPDSYLVVLENRGTSPEASSSEPASSAAKPAARQLERELKQVKERLRDIVEQYEASTEELKASNEELQAMNEELRSATEELETSREELQSINEELTAVNQEMKGKVDELALVNADLQNLMASTQIPTVFLDRDLRIKRYTPSAAELFHLIPSNVGRPLSHLQYRFDYPTLLVDADDVLKSLTLLEREVSGDDRVYLARLLPYRTMEDHIAGVLLTFVDITERKLSAEALRQSEERMRLLIESAKDFAIFTIDLESKVESWNSGAELMFGYSENEVLGRQADILFTPQELKNGAGDREMCLAREEGRAASESWYLRKDRSEFFGSGSVILLRDKAGSMRGFVKIMHDLTESKQTSDALNERMEELRRFNSLAVGREMRMIELKKEINELCKKQGATPRYSMEFEDTEGQRIES